MSDFQKAISALRSQGLTVTVNNFERVQVARIENIDFRGALITKPDVYEPEVKGLHHAKVLLNDMKSRFASGEDKISFGEQDIEEMTKLISTVNDLKFVERDYGIVINEHAELAFFKEIAEKFLTVEQLELIEEEMENIPEVDY